MGKLRLKNFIPGCLFTLLLFVQCLETLSQVAILQTLLKHIDELLVIAATAYLILHWRYLFQKKRLLTWIWLCFMTIGGISSLVFRYQPLIPTLMDALVVINKFMVGYLTAYLYSSQHPGYLYPRMNGVARIISVILFLLALHDMFLTPFFPVGEYRYFTNSLFLMFPHQTYLAAACVALLVLLGANNENQQNLPYMFMATFVGMMTLRGKAIAFFGIYWLLYICILVFRNRHYLALLISGGLAAVAVGMEQIVLYFFTDSHYSPRSIMTADSIKLMLQHFPLGTGFATFGSTLAQSNYSPLYLLLGYDGNYGMGPQDAMFLTDGFWPEIFAQFGLLGTVLFVVVLVLLFNGVLKTLKTRPKAGFAMLLIFINMLINSTAESSFFNPASFLLFILFGLLETKEQSTQKGNTL